MTKSITIEVSYNWEMKDGFRWPRATRLIPRHLAASNPQLMRAVVAAFTQKLKTHLTLQALAFHAPTIPTRLS